MSFSGTYSANPYQHGQGQALGTTAPGHETSADAVSTYFECITACSLDDGECVTRCVEILREDG